MKFQRISNNFFHLDKLNPPAKRAKGAHSDTKSGKFVLFFTNQNFLKNDLNINSYLNFCSEKRVATAKDDLDKEDLENDTGIVYIAFFCAQD